jgi:hypothetical protein
MTLRGALGYDHRQGIEDSFCFSFSFYAVFLIN